MANLFLEGGIAWVRRDDGRVEAANAGQCAAEIEKARKERDEVLSFREIKWPATEPCVACAQLETITLWMIEKIKQLEGTSAPVAWIVESGSHREVFFDNELALKAAERLTSPPGTCSPLYRVGPAA